MSTLPPQPNQGRLGSVFLTAHVTLPVLVGGAIYSLWRSKTLLVFTWYKWVGLETPLLALRADAAGIKHLLWRPILYSLPDALWVYSFTALMKYLWVYEPESYGRRFWTLLPLLLGIGGEIGQFFKIVPGTFDLMDILAYVVAWTAASISVETVSSKINGALPPEGIA